MSFAQLNLYADDTVMHQVQHVFNDNQHTLCGLKVAKMTFETLKV